jgi:hypothetical protein
MARKFSQVVAVFCAAILGPEFVTAQEFKQFDTSRIPKFPAAQDSSNQPSPQHSIKINDLRSEIGPRNTPSEQSEFRSPAIAGKHSEQDSQSDSLPIVRGQFSSSPASNNNYYSPGIGSQLPIGKANQDQPFRNSFNDLRGQRALEAARADAPSILKANDQQMVPQQLMPVDSRLAPQNTFRDESVRPISYDDNTSVTDAPALLVAGMLERYRLSSYSEPLPGVPLSVEEALNQTPFQNRPAMINQYWETYGAWSRLQLARERVASLSQLNRGGGSDGLLVDGARALAENDVSRAEIALQRAQQDLQRYLLNPLAESLLALPSDMPLTEAYETQHAVFAARNRLPFEHRAIHLTLPKIKALLDNSGKACRVNDDALRQLTQGGNLPAILQGSAQAHEARRQLIDTVVKYNQTIGDYSLKVAPIDVPADRLAGMLLPSNSNGTKMGEPSESRQAQLPQNPNRPMGARGQGFNPAFAQPASPQNPIGENPAKNSGAAIRQTGTGTSINDRSILNNNSILNKQDDPSGRNPNQSQTPDQNDKSGNNFQLGPMPQNNGSANPSQNSPPPQFQNPSLPQKGTSTPNQKASEPQNSENSLPQSEPPAKQGTTGDAKQDFKAPESKSFGGSNEFQSPTESK